MQYLLKTLPRIPKSCVWEITNRCNLRCIHCESSSGEGKTNELTTEEALQLCEQLAALGTTQVHLSGGEPLVRKDWHVIAERLHQLQIEVQLITNGLMFCQRISDKCKQVGIERIAISIDGAMKTHDSIRLYPHNRGRVSSFRKAYEALVLARLSGFKTTVITHINGRNLGELASLHQLLCLVPVDGWQLQLGAPLGRMKQTEPSYLITPGKLPFIVDFIASKQDTPFHISVTDEIGYYTEKEVALRRSDDEHYPFWVGCYAGMRSVAIESDGGVKGCPSMGHDMVEGNIRQRSLKEIWDDPAGFGYNQQWDEEKLEGFCQQCEFRHLCRAGCTSFAKATTGSVYQNDYCLYRNSRQERE